MMNTPNLERYEACLERVPTPSKTSNYGTYHLQCEWSFMYKKISPPNLHFETFLVDNHKMHQVEAKNQFIFKALYTRLELSFLLNVSLISFMNKEEGRGRAIRSSGVTTLKC